jgi:exodeoxyribonuclease-3
VAAPLKIVTWNVNSLHVRAEFLALYLDRVAPDVLALQELKLEEERVPREIFESRGYHLAIHGQRQWNGVLLASKAPQEDIWRGLGPTDEGEARLVSARIGGIRYIDCYCPQGQSVDSPKFPYKLRFFDGLTTLLSERASPTEPVVVLGDLNVAPAPEDVWSVEAVQGTPTYHPLEHQRWAQLAAWGLSDAVRPFVRPGTFSYWDYRGGAFRFNQGLRIDHILVTQPVRARLRGAWIDREDRKKKGDLKPSDHAPVGIEIEQ